MTRMTKDEHARRLNDQGGVCAICNKGDPIVVDRSQETGDVRGLLCRDCKCLLSWANDDPEMLQRALAFCES